MDVRADTDAQALFDAYQRRTAALAARDVNAIRNRYSTLMLAAYSGRAPVFDLATLESTRPDGSRSFFTRGADTAYTLAEEYTSDGGHLNEAARRMVAEQLLIFLARLPGS